MKSSKDLFKTNLDKAFSTISLNASTMGDHMKYKQGFSEQSLEGGLADGKTLMDLAQKHAYDDSTDSTSKDKIKDMYKELKLQLDKGIKVEMEHTKSRVMAKEIAMDHLSEDPKYYDKLRKTETKEAEGYSDFYPGGKTPGLTTDVLNTILTNIGKKGLEDKDEKPKNTFRTPKKKETKEENLKLSQNNKDMVYGIVDIVKKVKDISNRKTIANDMIKKFKKENIKFDYNSFLDMCGLGKEKKSETKEATGSGSSGAYSGPVFGGDDAFWERSRSETPKLKESDVEKVEATEATGSGSVGGYETPAMWAKSTKKKDWGPSRKTQYKGGSFVQVKKKCTKFPYCNQGDINALKLSKNESVKEGIKSVAKKLNIGENVIITILEHEYQKRGKRNK